MTATIARDDVERAPWLAAEDRRLAQEIREILTRLITVSEAPALKIASPTSHSKPGAKDLGEVKRDRTGAPAEDWSLHEHYRFRFVGAANDLARRVILCNARVALRSRTHGLSPLRKAGHGDSLSSEVERAQRESAETLLQDGEGVHAAEIAAETAWPIGWIQTTRERAGRDPDYGHERPHFRELDDDERTRLILSHKHDGLDQRAVARLLGVSVGTVARYWPAVRRRAA